MFDAPWLEPLLTAFVGGCCAGIAVTLAIVSRLWRSDKTDPEKRALHVRWYAARITLSRSALSLVAAMRALRGSRDDSEYRELRLCEAQRARTAWFTARRNLDYAAAALEGWYAEQGAPRSIVADEPMCTAALRAAVDGHDAAAAALAQKLRGMDLAAEQLMRDALSPQTPKSRRRRRRRASNF